MIVTAATIAITSSLLLVYSSGRSSFGTILVAQSSHTEHCAPVATHKAFYMRVSVGKQEAKNSGIGRETRKMADCPVSLVISDLARIVFAKIRGGAGLVYG